MYAGMVDGVQAVAVEPAPPADICGGGQGSACDLANRGAAAPSKPADVIRKSLRVDIRESPTCFRAHYIGASGRRPCLKATTEMALYSGGKPGLCAALHVTPVTQVPVAGP